MEMNPGANPHCGMKAVSSLSREFLDEARALHILRQIEIMRARALGGFGDRCGQRVGRGGKHDVVAFHLMGEIARIAHRHAAQRDILLRHAFEARRIAVHHRHVVIARRGQKFR